MGKKTFKEMVNEEKDLEEELIDNPIDILEDAADLQVGTAIKKTVATPVRVAKSLFDLLDF